MDHTAPVSELQGTRHFAKDPDCFLNREAALSRQLIRQALAVYVRHREIEQVVFLTHEVHRDNVPVRELRDRFRLAAEPLDHRFGEHDLRRDDLDRESALERLITDQEDDRESALADGSLYQVIGAERLLESPAEVLHVAQGRFRRAGRFAAVATAAVAVGDRVAAVDAVHLVRYRPHAGGRFTGR